MRVRPTPCDECPWVRTTPPGQFPIARYDALRSTTVAADGSHAGLGSPMFACHLTAEGRELPCAGWLAAVGLSSVTVRLLVAQGDIPPAALRPGADWPDLFETYDEMASTQGGENDGENAVAPDPERPLGRRQPV